MSLRTNHSTYSSHQEFGSISLISQHVNRQSVRDNQKWIYLQKKLCKLIQAIPADTEGKLFSGTWEQLHLSLNSFLIASEEFSITRSLPDLKNAEKEFLNIQQEFIAFLDQSPHSKVDVNSLFRKIKEFFMSQTLDNSTQIIFYIFSLIGSAVRTDNDQLTFVSDWTHLPQGPALNGVANGILGAVSILSLGFTIYGLYETTHSLKRFQNQKEELLQLKTFADQMIEVGEEILELCKKNPKIVSLGGNFEESLNDAIEEIGDALIQKGAQLKISTEAKVQLISKSIFSDQVKIGLQVMTIVNLVVQLISAMVTLADVILDIAHAIMPVLTTIAIAALWIGVISSGIGVILGLLGLAYYLYKYVRNCQERKELEGQIKHLEALKKKYQNEPDLEVFFIHETHRLHAKKQYLECEQKRLINCLITSSILLVFAILSIPLNFFTGGSLGIVSGIVIGTLLIASGLIIYQKTYLKKQTSDQKLSLKEEIQKDIQKYSSKPQAQKISKETSEKIHLKEDILDYLSKDKFAKTLPREFFDKQFSSLPLISLSWLKAELSHI